MDTLMLIIAIVVLLVLAAIAGAAWVIFRGQRSRRLRGRFGPEYDYTVNELGDRQRAESELIRRERRARSLELRSLTPEERSRFAEEWQEVQTRFVDRPLDAIVDADLLVTRAMEARGYPDGDFQRRLDYISANHPHVAADYRAAHAITESARSNNSTTEDLRQAMVHYRELLEDLLETGDISDESRSDRFRKQEVV